MNVEIIREDYQSDVKVLQVFNTCDRWSAEKMNNFPFLGSQRRYEGLTFRNASGVVNLWIAMSAELCVWKNVAGDIRGWRTC